MSPGARGTAARAADHPAVEKGARLGYAANGVVNVLIGWIAERRSLSVINLAYVVALVGFAVADSTAASVVFYLIYSFIVPVSPIASSTYLRKIATEEDLAPSLAMGVTLLHATAIVVPVAAGAVLNFVGYQVPFLIAAGFALLTVRVIRGLDPARQRSAARLAADETAAGAIADQAS